MEGVQPKEDKQSTHVKIVNKKQAYFCSNCDFPSDEIGLLQPCKHVFCLSCSSLMSDCAICTETVLKMKVVKDMSQLFVSPLTLQGFASEEELMMHLKQFQ